MPINLSYCEIQIMQKEVRRAVIFAHFDKNDLVDEYVFYYLKELWKICDKVVFVTTSNICKQDIANLKKIKCQIIKRENVGYDFISYQVGLKKIKFNNYDEVVICNDSVYGPIFPLEEIFKKMEQENCDFWGMTENYEYAYHLQSYFLVFRKNIFNSKIFHNFWQTINIFNSKQTIIQKFEIGLSQLLLKEGFLPIAVAKSNKFNLFRQFGLLLKIINLHSVIKFIKNEKNIDIKGIINTKALNPTHFFWKELLVNNKMPFVKVELLRDNPENININNIYNIINKLSSYEINLIKNHLARVRNA